MKKILFIAFFFPPVEPENFGGVQRTVKFIKYLVRKGWNVMVLTALNSERIDFDKSMISDNLVNVQVCRTKVVSLRKIIDTLHNLKLHKISSLINLLSIPDHYILWLRPAYTIAKKLIIENNIKIVYTTSSPVTSHLVGLLLKKKFREKIFWVADFRDPWSQNKVISKQLTSVRKYIHFLLEKKILDSCDHIIHSTKLNRTNTINVFKLPYSKVTTIYNGYDEEDFNFNMLELKKETRYFNVVYSGNFYLDYNPEIFLNSIKEFIIKKGNIRLMFVGDGARWVRSFLIRENISNKLKQSIILIDSVEHSESVKTLYKADLLLLLLPNYMDYCVPGKLFEYIRSKKPIFALVPQNGETSKILSQVNVGYIVEPEDRQGILNTFTMIYSKWEIKQLKVESNLTEIQKYNRKFLTDQLINIFEKYK